jgi:pimeloyl-ACP methyl ester carboxylesterase
MTPPTTRVLTPARIVALTLLAFTVACLGYVRFGPEPDRVSVPDGARAGQLVRLEPCEYATEDGGYDADCGTLVVPENRADADSRLIAVPVTRIHARSAHPAEPIFKLEGGPGITNMKFPAASRYAENHDVVLVGYRGIDGSERLDCPEVESAIGHSTDVLADKSFRAYGDAFRSCADRLTADGVAVVGYGLVDQVDDLEAARKALGYDRIDLLSESAGTRTAQIYSWRYPKSIHRSVMVAVNPPGHYIWYANTTDEQIGRYAALCAEDASCSKRTDGLAATLKTTKIPDRWGILPIQDSNVRVASFIGMMESTTAGMPISAPLVLDSWLAADEGDGGGLWLASLLGEVMFPKMFVWGQYAAVGSIDQQAAREEFAVDGDATNFGRAASAFAWGGGRLADAWPTARGVDAYRTMRTSNVETLLVGGSLDGSTPPQVATRELLPYLPNGRQVILHGIGHTGDLWNLQPEANTRLITTYFDSGRVDDSLYEAGTVDFTPSVGLGGIAKILVGSMLGLAALAVVTLLLMARRVRRRGRFGQKASAVLRTLAPVVLGAGGWFLGVLVVVTTMPGVPLDDPLFAVLSVGLPIGLGVHYASVDRSRPARARTAGLVAATTGALVGAGLGFNAAADLAALLTAIVGAAVGANLGVLALDVYRDRAARDGAATAPIVVSTPAGA